MQTARPYESDIIAQFAALGTQEEYEAVLNRMIFEIQQHNKNMSDFKTRLIEEKEDLDRRLVKLQLFLNSDDYKEISPIQQTLLNVQEQTMATYSQILAERISWLPYGVDA